LLSYRWDHAHAQPIPPVIQARKVDLYAKEQTKVKREREKGTTGVDLSP
jgi:hypothetical protein